MKIKREEELIDFLAARKQRRKRELISFRQDLGSKAVKGLGRTTRSAIILSYAHWEGFVKEAARAYVQLVSHKSRAFADLSANFQALVCRQELKVAQQATKRIGPQIAIVNLFVDRRHQSSTIDENAAIDTESNLKSDVFENICLCIGLNFLQSWQIEAPFIDDLFENRCAIAHGELLEPDSKYATEVLDAVLRWIDSFSTDIENAVVSKAYIRVR